MACALKDLWTCFKTSIKCGKALRLCNQRKSRLSNSRGMWLVVKPQYSPSEIREVGPALEKPGEKNLW